MIKRTLKQIAAMVNGEVSDPSKEDLLIEGVSTDSRTINPKNLYIPLVGEIFDGRIFIKECETKGASAFIIDKDFSPNKDITIPYILVDDTKKALRDLARAYRSELDIKIIAITGSNGKTTSKDVLAKVLSEKYKVQKTMGNLNNDIGVPKTLLDLNEDSEIGVIELGTDNFGDISLTTDLARPDIAAILNIGDSHLLNLKTKEGIVKAKMEITEGLKKGGTFIYNIDDPILKKEVPTYDIAGKVLSFGQSPDSDFNIKLLESTFEGVKFSHNNDLYFIPLMGDHQVYNAGFVVMVAKMLGLSSDQINDGLRKCTSTKNRSEIIELDGFDILDDAYKSNPQSLQTGLKTAYMLNGYSKKIVVLADMLELGDDEINLHYQAGKDINANEIDYCLFFGPLGKYMYEGALENFAKSRIFYFTSKEELANKLKTLVTKSSLVFFKGSHGMHLEEIIENIKSLNI